MNVLVLDDCPDRLKKFSEAFRDHVVDKATKVNGAIYLLECNSYDIVCLDHDLDGKSYCPSDEHSGAEVARWLVMNQAKIKWPSIIFLHSLNYLGRQNMKALLPDAVEEPWLWERHSGSVENLIRMIGEHNGSTSRSIQ